MSYFTPVKAIIPRQGTSLEQLFQDLQGAMKNAAGFRKDEKLSAKRENLGVYVKGNKFLSWFDDYAPIMRYEAYYFLVLELDEGGNRVLLSLQNLKYRHSEDDLLKRAPILNSIAPEKTSVTEWFESGELPRELLSNALSFMKLRGPASLLF